MGYPLRPSQRARAKHWDFDGEGNARARSSEEGGSSTTADSGSADSSTSGDTGQWIADKSARATTVIGRGLEHVPAALEWASGPGFRLMILASVLLIAFLLLGQQEFIVVRILGWEIVGAGPQSSCRELRNCAQVRDERLLRAEQVT